MLNIIAYNKIYTKVEFAFHFFSRNLSRCFLVPCGEKVAPLIEKVKAAEETTESAKLQLREADAFGMHSDICKKFTCTIIDIYIV